MVLLVTGWGPQDTKKVRETPVGAATIGCRQLRGCPFQIFNFLCPTAASVGEGQTSCLQQIQQGCLQQQLDLPLNACLIGFCLPA